MNLIEENSDQAISTCKGCEDCKKQVKVEIPVKQIEADHCSDIRNHISPNTKVSER
jgi:hypothetical protein